MPLPEQVFGKWVHSHEEDEGDRIVYRRPSYAFPPARGRDGIELRPDGTATYYAIAATDGTERVDATWEATGSSDVKLTFPSGKHPFVLTLIRTGEDELVVSRRPG